jgi:hypothetical protein
MKRWLIATSFSFLLPGPAPADTPVSGDITANTTWNVAGSPYVVQDNTYVTTNSVLTIEPGVTVAFDGSYLLRAEAGSSIQAVGVAGQRILFTSNLPSPAPGDWNRVTALSSPASSFEFCTFEYGTRALELDGSELTLTKCTFRHASQYGLLVKECSPTILDCNFYENPTGLYVGDTTHSTQPVITSCDFHDNGNYCVYLAGFASGPLLTIDAENNWWGTDVGSEIEDEIRHDVDNAAIFGHVDFDPWLTTTAVEPMSWGRIRERFR